MISISDSSVAWVSYDGIHDVYITYMEAIDGDLKEFSIDRDPGLLNILIYVKNAWSLRKYDYIICDVDVSLRTGVSAKLFSILDPFVSTAKLIRFCGNANYFFISTSSVHGTRPYSNRFLSNFVDGGLANSQFTAINGSKFINGPIKKVTPSISEKLYEDLAENDYSDGKTLLSIGFDHEVKGTDLLLKAFKMIKKEHPEAKLLMVGDGRERYDDIEGVEAYGYQDEVAKYYKQANLYVQPSKGDGFGVVVAEAMRAGVPPIVTDSTGAKSYVSDIDSNLVRKPEGMDIFEGIKYFFNLSQNEKYSLSKKFKERSKEFDPENKKEEFKRKFEELKGEI